MNSSGEFDRIDLMTGGVEVSLHVLTPSKDGIPGNSQVDSSANAFHQKRSLDS
jgi:hypothetical protein